MADQGPTNTPRDNVAAEELPTYGDLEEQERSNPNSRFGRWRTWVEKRAAERYADITPEDRARQRERGWGLPIDTEVPEQAPPLPGFMTSPMSAQLAPQRLGDTTLSLYEFGSRFIPHSSTPIRCLLPLLDDRYLLIGGDDGLSMLDVFPETESLALENGSVLHALEGAKRRDLWTGETIYQMNLLECYPDNQGGLQGVVLALVGPEDTEPEKEQSRTIRMYNLASLFSLVKWTATHPDAKPPVIHGPKGWSHQQTGSRRLQRPSAHAITKSLKSMVIDHGRPDTPGSMSSVKTGSMASERLPPSHQDSTDTADSWDLVEDLPLRWATDYVNLAGNGSKLSNTSVLFYELWKNEGIHSRGTSMLAVVTRAAILLYETPKGERSFRYVKEFYTPLPAKLVTFVQQTNNDVVRAISVHHEPGERLKKERPLSRGGPEGMTGTPPRARRHSVPGDSTYGSQLSLFVIFEKKAGLIRIADSSVSEMELWDDGGRPPSPIGAQSPGSIHSMQSSAGFRKSIQALDFHRDGRGTWQPMITLDVPYPPSGKGEQPSTALSKTILILSRGSQTHILPCPLPMPLPNYPPLRVIRWHTPPSRISARVSLIADQPAMLQLVAFSDKGIEIAETTVNFIFQRAEPGSPSKGKGKGRSISVPSDPLNRAQWHSMETTKPLCRGGVWHRLDTSSGQPELRPSEWALDLASHPAATSKLETGKGIYAAVQRGLDDYRVIWLGDDVSL